MDDDDDALFSEVLALLAADAASPARDVRHQSASRKKLYAVGSAARRKAAIDEQRREQQHLNDQLHQLRGDSGMKGTPLRESAAVERLRRRRAEHECRTLRDAVYQQTQFLRGLRGVFAVTLESSLTLNLCHHLHNFTRLPRARSTRQQEYVNLTRDERLDAAIELLRRETEMISVPDSHIETDYAQESDETCAVSTKSVFVMETGNVRAVLRAACVAVRDIVVRCRAYQCVGVSGEIVDADNLSPANLQHRVTSIRRKSAGDCEDFSIESRAVTVYKMVGDAAVVLWDFVDEDQLHPLVETPDISRQSVGA